ncbi:MAG: hypothetical protein ACFCU4_09415 [Puniceicoccaceae bacterium]
MNIYQQSLTSITTALAAISLQGQATLDVQVDNGSRFSDFFSAAYAEVGLSPQGMYSLVDDTPFGAVNPFPFGNDWNGFGVLTLSGIPTLSGVETFTITDAFFDVDVFALGSFASVIGSYITSLSNVVGTVELNEGVVTDFSFGAQIDFTFVSAPGLPYSGTIEATPTSFALSVDDDSIDFGFGPVRQVWDFSGSSATLSVVPEANFAFVVPLLALGSACSRRFGRRRLS